MLHERTSRIRIHPAVLILIAYLLGAASVIDRLTPLALAGSPKRPSSREADARRDDPFRTPIVQHEEVRFIEFDVAVEERGKEGWRPAQGLKEDQFTLRVGGRKTPLELFESHCGPAPVVAEAAERDANGPVTSAVSPTAEGSAGAAAATKGDVVRYILYLEEMHLSFEDRHRSFKAALEWAATARPDDEVMIVLGGFGLRIVRPMLKASRHLTEDLEAAMADFGSNDMWGNQEDSRIGEIESTLKEAGYFPAYSLAQGYAEEAFLRARQSLENMKSLMSLFAKIEGTKNLILFSDKLRYIPGNVYPLATDAPDTWTDLRQVADAANERDVRIYAVQPRGLEVEPQDPLPRGQNPHDDLADDAITMLTSETGGRIVERTNRLAAIFDRVAEDASCAYRVGFHFRPRYSGSSERMEISVSGPARGYRARYRRSVEDPTRETIETDLLTAAMIDPASARDIPVSVRAVPLFSGAASSRVRIEVSVPLAGILALPGGGSSGGAERLLVQLGGRVIPQIERPGPATPREERGAWADVDTTREALPFAGQAAIDIPLDPSGRAERASSLVRVVEVDAPAGAYRVVAVVEDRQTQSVGAGLADFRAGAAAEALGPIGIALEDPGSVVVHGALEEEAKAEAAARHPKKTGKRLHFAGSGLPAKSVLASGGEIAPDRDALVYYGVCGVPAGGGTLTRRIRCEGLEDPVTMPPRPAPAPGGEDPCALVVERIAASSLAGGTCEFTVVLSVGGRESERRTLPIRIHRSGS